MCTLLDTIWFLLGGVWLWLGYMFFGTVACIFVVTIPAGITPSRIVSYVLWPFGKRVVDIPNADAGSAFMNVVRFFVVGLWLVLGYVMTALAQSITTIGIPVAIANIKMIPTICPSFGRMVVTDPKTII